MPNHTILTFSYYLIMFYVKKNHSILMRNLLKIQSMHCIFLMLMSMCLPCFGFILLFLLNFMFGCVFGN